MTVARRPLAALLVTCLLVLSACGGSSDSTGGGGDTDRSIRGMLALVPDLGDNASFVSVALYGQLADALDLEPLATPGDSDEEIERLVLLTTGGDARDTGVALAPPELAGGQRLATALGALGFWPSDLTAEVQAGKAPSVTTVAIGDVDAATVLQKAESIDGASRSTVGGADVVSWLEDLQIDPGIETPVGRVPGQAGRIAVPADRTIVHTTADGPMTAAIETIDGDGTSLADRDDLGPIADALDDEGVLGALLSTEPIGPDNRPLSPEQREALSADALAPYVAYGVGGARDGDQAIVVIVLAHADEDAAATNAERLRTNVAEGVDPTTSSPWSELLTAGEVEQHGTLVVGRFHADSPMLWSQLVLRQAPLLATAG